MSTDDDVKAALRRLCAGLPVNPLPPPRRRDQTMPHAPARVPALDAHQQKLAVRNALRYFPASAHATLAGEFTDELLRYGHIYMYRFLPPITIRAYAISDYPAVSRHAAAIMHMIMNNLDDRVAQFPQELVTYGGNGQVFSNWAQFWLVMHYLSRMTDKQTLVMYSGHPLGLFPSHHDAPRAVITNGMVVPNYSSRQHYDALFALGATMYGQMTAGSYCYIGPQGIVHGTTLTILNAGRRYLHADDLAGKVLVTSGLGGMSGAQAKAAVICRCVAVIAEVSREAIEKRYRQGWLLEVIDNLDTLVARIRLARTQRRPVSIGYHGNVVDVWERLVAELERTGELLVELGTDQTSCHNPFNGGYCPVQVSYNEAKTAMSTDPHKFKQLVTESLRRQVSAINKLSDHGMFFWDYGNAFLLEASRAGADVLAKDDNGVQQFRYPSYVQHIMGDIFSLGFGPFRWVCTSSEDKDLRITDSIAQHILESIVDKEQLSESVKQQYVDNIDWIKHAHHHNLVVGSQARILYSDCRGRVAIAVAFNAAVRQQTLAGPVVVSRDHHDVSGTDSPYRETSNIDDGSLLCADMAVQNCIGDSFRGATWVALHNGGGVGWGEAVNGGFGLVLDGSVDAERRAKSMLSWDVNNGVARRCWSGNKLADESIRAAMRADDTLHVTLPHDVDDAVDHVIDAALSVAGPDCCL